MEKKLRKKAAIVITDFSAAFSRISSKANIILVLIVLIMCYGCCKSTSPDDKPLATIEILQNGSIQETFIVTEENDGDIYPIYDSKLQIGEVEIDVFECSHPPYEDVYTYFLTIARKNSCYTIFNIVNSFDTLRIDYQLDFDAINDSLICGTMYDPYDGLIRNARFSVWKDSIFVDSLFTDSLGRFETNLEPNNYLLLSDPMGFLNPEFELIEGYADYYIPYYFVYVDKPNIYLYPETAIELDVSISFPRTGEVVTSIPEYHEQWKKLQIEPNGTIDGQYEFLFYESMQPNFFQRTKGWIVERKNLEAFFRNNLKESGFIQTEIDDFIEYWIPLLTDLKYFAIYPQYNEQLDPLIQLNFSKQPDSILRLTYVIEKLCSSEIKLEEPEILSFKRVGFVIAEWGVVFDRDK